MSLKSMEKNSARKYKTQYIMRKIFIITAASVGVGLTAMMLEACNDAAAKADYASYVDPMIGTGGHGLSLIHISEPTRPST